MTVAHFGSNHPHYTEIGLAARSEAAPNVFGRGTIVTSKLTAQFAIIQELTDHDGPPAVLVA